MRRPGRCVLARYSSPGVFMPSAACGRTWLNVATWSPHARALSVYRAGAARSARVPGLFDEALLRPIDGRRTHDVFRDLLVGRAVSEDVPSRQAWGGRGAELVIVDACGRRRSIELPGSGLSAGPRYARLGVRQGSAQLGFALRCARPARGRCRAPSGEQDRRRSARAIAVPHCRRGARWAARTASVETGAPCARRAGAGP